MAFDLKNIMQPESKYYLLGIAIEPTENQYQLMVVSYKNDELNIEERYFSNTFDEDFKSHLDKEYPVILYTEGESVINKKTGNIAGYKSNLLFKANLDDFFFYEYFQDNTVFISISRKNYIQGLVESLKKIDRTVIHVTFGPFVLANITSILSKYNEVSTFNHNITIANDAIVSFGKKENIELYNIGDDVLNHKELPLIASFFDFKFPKETIGFNDDFLLQNKANYKYKTWLKPFIAISVIVLFFSIVMSHFMLDSYLEKLAEKQSLFLFSTQGVETLNRLKEEHKLKESILESSAIFNKEFVVKYISDIGNATPNEITLRKVEFLPIAKKVRSNEKVQFNLKTIMVQGYVEDDAVFNSWVLKLQNMNWVNKVEINEYAQENRQTNSFKLNIGF